MRSLFVIGWVAALNITITNMKQQVVHPETRQKKKPTDKAPPLAKQLIILFPAAPAAHSGRVGSGEGDKRRNFRPATDTEKQHTRARRGEQQRNNEYHPNTDGAASSSRKKSGSRENRERARRGASRLTTRSFGVHHTSCGAPRAPTPSAQATEQPSRGRLRIK